jgi:hypothetical protein
MAGEGEVICVKREQKYFCEWGWTWICCFARLGQITDLVALRSSVSE